MSGQRYKWSIELFENLKPKVSRKSTALIAAAALLFVGVSAQASGFLNTPAGGYLICVDTKTGAVTHPGTSKCKKGQKRLVLGAQGPAGATGANGQDGLVGASGLPGNNGNTLWTGNGEPLNTLGVPGDSYLDLVGKKIHAPKAGDGTWPIGISIVGPQGPQGPGGSGPAGPAGPAGANGTNATIAITELFICDGSDPGSVADEKCKIGMTGPGGGKIFFVDYNDIYSDFNYLEVSDYSDDCVADGPIRAWNAESSGVIHNPTNSESSWRVGRGVINTAAMLEDSTQSEFGVDYSYESDTAGAAFYAENFDCEETPGYKTDWFLGSLGEMKLLLEASFEINVGGAQEKYWTSNSIKNQHTKAFAIGVETGTVTVYEELKSLELSVRPIRRF
jgi:hypothetical protein